MKKRKEMVSNLDGLLPESLFSESKNRVNANYFLNIK